MNAVVAPRHRLQAVVGVNHRAVGADQRHAVGEPVERALELVARIARPPEPPRHVKGLPHMRHQRTQRSDAVALDVAHLRRAMHADRGKFVRGLVDDAGNEVAHVHARQEFRIERRTPHGAFVHDLEVPQHVVERLLHHERQPDIGFGKAGKVGDFFVAWHAERIHLCWAQRLLAEHFQGRRIAADRARRGGERLRPKALVQAGRVDGLDGRKQVVAAHAQCAP